MGPRWPLRIRALDDELLSSYLTRAAHRHRLSPGAFTALWWPDRHVRPPEPRPRLCGTVTSKEQAFLDALAIDDLRGDHECWARYGDWLDDHTLRAINRLGDIADLELPSLYTGLNNTRRTQGVLICLHAILMDAADPGSGKAVYRQPA